MSKAMAFNIVGLGKSHNHSIRFELQILVAFLLSCFISTETQIGKYGHCLFKKVRPNKLALGKSVNLLSKKSGL